MKMKLKGNRLEIEPLTAAKLELVAEREGRTVKDLVTTALEAVLPETRETVTSKGFAVTFTRQQAAVIEDIASRLRCTPEEFIAGGFASAIEAKFLSENCNYSESIVSWFSDVLHYSDNGDDITALGEYFCIMPSAAEQEAPRMTEPAQP